MGTKKEESNDDEVKYIGVSSSTQKGKDCNCTFSFYNEILSSESVTNEYTTNFLHICQTQAVDKLPSEM